MSCKSKTKLNCDYVRQGPANVKGTGTFAKWFWKAKWLVLKDATVEIRQSQSFGRKSILIPLSNILKVERTDLKPYCFLLETKGKQYHVSLVTVLLSVHELTYIDAQKSDSELYNWQDDIYSRSPLVGGTGPTNFVHHAHVAFDEDKGEWFATEESVPEACARVVQKTMDILTKP
ncbi:hypothetical protein BD626DRAFT_573748 [Schizophyllum amplum]|uniref:PH domain-containing protein n=1 Tax=Schizophyllum amplum TaxID=97359 RepID=A0A550C0J8_9AGAR|nr:hypothetical protein BD626DRAFT_573748 [Auriculariopsis ampla]